ncbi:hypothetical protein [Prochlorococcus marinus]|uniref:hypothetical protein n=1 Tax=Prochlorococcus marinus TaxID=1219 RepID=UPI0002E092AC|nr:hypothetical protein [Prochlorococcus marinus]
MYKRTHSGKTQAFQKKIIFQKEFNWNVNDEITTLTIEKIDDEILESIDKNNQNLCIFAWDKDQEEVFKIENYSKSNFPIVIDLSKKFYDFVGIPRFEIRIYEKNSKKILSHSKAFVMSSDIKNDKSKLSLIRMVPSDLGSQIAQISYIKGEPPYLEINKNYIAKNGQKIGLSEIKNLVRNDPNFCVGFWPGAIKEIFKIIFEENNDDFEQEWIQRWLFNIDNIAPGNLEKNSDGELHPIKSLQDDDDFISDISKQYIDSFIKKKDLDNGLIKKVRGIE